MSDAKNNNRFQDFETLTFIIDSIDALIFVIDLQEYKILYANLKAKEAFGEIEGEICYEVLQENQEYICPFCSTEQEDFPLAPNATYEWESFNTKTKKTYLFSDKVIQWTDERLVKVQIGIDISKQKMLEEEIKRQKDEALDSFEALTNATIEGLLVLDEHKKCIFVNKVAPKLFGYSADEMIGRAAFEFVADESKAMVKEYIQNQNQDPYEAVMVRKDGSVFPALLRGKDITLGEKKVRISAVMDITAMKEKEKEITKLAYYDALTDLPNRTLLIDRLGQIMHRSMRDLTYGALIFIDLDDFKTINDTKGHLVGDMILIECAKRLKSITRQYDTVARLGGDEFVILIDTQTQDQQVAESKIKMIARKILKVICKPFLVNHHDFRLSASLGIAMFVDEQYSIEDLMRYADSAMYYSKERKKGTFSFYNPGLQEKIEKKAILLEKLHIALEDDVITVHYQKLIDKSENVIGVEALARWEDDVLGYIPPSEFIPLAEESGLIIKLGERVLKAAVNLIKTWENDTLKKEWIVSINVSLKQFERYNFEEIVQAEIEAQQVAPHKLRLELTESLLLKNSEKALEKIEHLKTLGVSFSIDDFGTGYSSLLYLKNLPIDELKIDRSFVKDILEDKSDETIVLAILDLGRKFGFKVTAKGVESKEMHRKLLDLGCEYFQGYYFGKAAPIDKL